MHILNQFLNLSNLLKVNDILKVGLLEWNVYDKFGNNKWSYHLQNLPFGNSNNHCYLCTPLGLSQLSTCGTNTWQSHPAPLWASLSCQLVALIPDHHILSPSGPLSAAKLLPLDMSMVRTDSDMIARQVSLRHTWCLILSLVSVWSSHLYDMLVCPLLTSAIVVLGYHADSQLYIR